MARSFRTADGQFTLDNYAYFFTSAEALQSLLFTLAEALTVMALSVVLSFLLALYLRFSKSPVSRALGKLYLLPRFIPGIAAVYAVMNVIKDSGSINRIAAAFGVDYKPGLLYDLKRHHSFKPVVLHSLCSHDDERRAVQRQRFLCGKRATPDAPGGMFCAASFFR